MQSDQRTRYILIGLAFANLLLSAILFHLVGCFFARPHTVRIGSCMPFLKNHLLKASTRKEVEAERHVYK